MHKIESIKDLKEIPIFNDIQQWLKDECPVKDIQKWCLEKDYDISLFILKKLKKELFKDVIETVKKKSAELVDDLAATRLNLADDIEDSIKKINSILDNTDLNELKPISARELATLLQAKANLVRAELEARGEMPRKNLAILNLIEKAQELKEKVKDKKEEVIINV